MEDGSGGHEKRPGGIVAPPMFGVVYSSELFMELFFDPELNADMNRVVHAEQDMRYIRLVKPGDTIITLGKIATIAEKSSGEFFEVDFTCRNQKSEVVLEARSGFFVRGQKKDGGKKEEKPAEEKKPVAFSQKMKVAEDQMTRYAEGSGDHNPIHIIQDFAKSVGLPDVILQGLCTMAFAQKAVIDTLCNKDPERLKRLKVRFAKSVFKHDEVTTGGWLIEKKGPVGVYGFETKNQNGVAVITNGLTEVSL
jgi:acyl dehydratase